MLGNLEWLIARRYIRGVVPAAFFSAKSRVSFTVMVVAIALLVVVLSVFNGFQVLMKKAIWAQGAHITLFPVNSEGIAVRFRENIETIRALPVSDGSDDDESQVGDVLQNIHGSISSPGLLSLGVEYQPVEIRAVEYRPDAFGNPGPEFPPILRYDRNLMDKLGETTAVVVGDELAKFYGLQVGQYIKLYAPRGGVAKKGGEFTMLDFVIAGTFKTNFYETDSQVIYMALAIGQNFYGIPGVNQINIKVANLPILHRVKAALERSLTGFRLEDIESRQRNLLAALQLEKTLISIILFLFIVLAAVGMVATIYSQIRAKRKSLGILKALGLSPRSLLFIFTLNGFILGILASLTGGIMGIFFALIMEKIILAIETMVNWVGALARGPMWSGVVLIPKNIYYFDQLPVNIDLYLVLLVTFSATLLSGLAGYFPARKAAALDPVETIRYDD